MIDYKQKYLKYKLKYQQLLKQKYNQKNLNLGVSPFLKGGINQKNQTGGMNYETRRLNEEFIEEEEENWFDNEEVREQLDTENYLSEFENYLKESEQESNLCIVNLMWINKEMNDNEYIFPENIKRSVVNYSHRQKEYNYLESILKWLDMNYKVYLWYDSTSVSEIQFEKTQEIFKDRNLILMDINIILENYRLIKKCPIYLIVDFYRLIILDFMAQTQDSLYIIYSDMLCSPIEKNNIFRNTNLNTYQIVLSDRKEPELRYNPHRYDAYENSFIVIKNLEPLKTNLTVI